MQTCGKKEKEINMDAYIKSGRPKKLKGKNYADYLKEAVKNDPYNYKSFGKKQKWAVPKEPKEPSEETLAEKAMKKLEARKRFLGNA